MRGISAPKTGESEPSKQLQRKSQDHTSLNGGITTGLSNHFAKSNSEKSQEIPKARPGQDPKTARRAQNRNNRNRRTAARGVEIGANETALTEPLRSPGVLLSSNNQASAEGERINPIKQSGGVRLAWGKKRVTNNHI